MSAKQKKILFVGGSLGADDGYINALQDAGYQVEYICTHCDAPEGYVAPEEAAVRVQTTTADAVVLANMRGLQQRHADVERFAASVLVTHKPTLVFDVVAKNLLKTLPVVPSPSVTCVDRQTSNSLASCSEHLVRAVHSLFSPKRVTGASRAG